VNALATGINRSSTCSRRRPHTLTSASSGPSYTERRHTTSRFHGSNSTFTGWPGGNGWTVIIASKNSKSDAETIATEAQGKGLTVGILNSDDFSSLNPGYQVVFTEKFDSKSAAEDSLSDVQNDYPDAYVRQVKE